MEEMEAVSVSGPGGKGDTGDSDNMNNLMEGELQKLQVALQNKEEMIQTLSSQVSKLTSELMDAEKMGAAKVVHQLSQFGQLVSASIDFAFTLGRDSAIYSQWHQIFANGALGEVNKLKETLEMRISQLSELGSPTILGNLEQIEQLKLALEKKEDVIKTLSSQVSNLQQLIDTDKREAVVAENKLNHATLDIVLGGNSSASSQGQNTFTNKAMAKENKVKDTLGMKMSVVSQLLLGSRTSSTIDLESLEGTLPNYEEMEVDDVIELDPVTGELDNDQVVNKVPPKKHLIGNIIESYIASGHTRLSLIELVSIHVKLALDLISPWHSQNLSSQFNLNSNWKEEILTVGIVKVQNSVGGVQFIEDEFADYFVARWLADRLTEGSWNKELNLFMIKAVLETNFQEYDDLTKSFMFLKAGLCSALNAILGEPEVKKKTTRGYPIDFTYLCDERYITDIGHACAQNELPHLFNLVLHLGTFHGSGISHLLLTKSVIFVVARKPNLEFLKIARSLLKNDYWMNVDLKVQAVKAAAQRGDLPMVQFIVNKMRLSKMTKESENELDNMIPLFTENSRDNSEELIAKKTKILQLLNSVNPSLKNEKSRRGEALKLEKEGPPLLGCEVHSRLLAKLIQLGANVHAIDSDNDTVLHCNADSSEAFESLLNIIPDEDLKKLVHVKGFRGDTPLMRVVRWATPTRQILEKLLEAGSDINAVDNEGYSVIAVAIREGKDASLVNLLMELGGSMAWRGRNHENLLHLAGGHVRPELVSEFLKNKVDPNCKDDDGLTPLDYLFRSEQGDFELLTKTGVLLQNAGGTLNDIEEEGQKLLHRTVKNGTCCAVQLLVEFGLNVNEVDKHGNTPLHLVVVGCRQQIEKVKCLLNNNANPNAMNANGETPLHVGLRNRDSLSQATFRLLKTRTNVPLKESFIVLALEYVICKFTYHSVERLQAQLVSLELDRKEYVQYKNRNREPLLHIATICGHEAAVELLVREGLDVNVRNELLQTSLHVTISVNDKKKAFRMVKCLIDNGADPGAKDGEDFTFLHRFIMTSDIKLDEFNRLVEYLVVRDDLTAFNIHGGPDGSTPLQEAVKQLGIKMKTISNLVSHGVDINILDRRGDSVLSYAVRGQKDEKFLTKLKDMGLDWNHINFKGQNLLHIASQAGNWKVVSALLDYGLSANLEDKEGNSPFHWVVQEGKKNHLMESLLLGTKQSSLLWKSD